MLDIEPSQGGLSIEALLAAARVSPVAEDAAVPSRVEDASTSADDARPRGTGDPLAALRALGMVADAPEMRDASAAEGLAPQPSEPFDLAAALGYRREPPEPAPPPSRRGALQSARPGEAGKAAEAPARTSDRKTAPTTDRQAQAERRSRPVQAPREAAPSHPARALATAHPAPTTDRQAQAKRRSRPAEAPREAAPSHPAPRRGALQSARPGEAGKASEDSCIRAAAQTGDLKIAPPAGQQAQADRGAANVRVLTQPDDRQAQAEQQRRSTEGAAPALPAAALPGALEAEPAKVPQFVSGHSSREVWAAERHAAGKARRRRRAAAAALVALALVLAAAAFLAFFFAGEGANEASSGAPSQAVYRYRIEAPDGTLCSALERAFFDADGMLEQSVVEVELPSDDQARAWSEDMRRIFGDGVREASTVGSRAHVTVDLSSDSVSRAAYEALLANNAEGFQKAS